MFIHLRAEGSKHCHHLVQDLRSRERERQGSPQLKGHSQCCKSTSSHLGTMDKLKIVASYYTLLSMVRVRDGQLQVDPQVKHRLAATLFQRLCFHATAIATKPSRYGKCCYQLPAYLVVSSDQFQYCSMFIVGRLEEGRYKIISVNI